MENIKKRKLYKVVSFGERHGFKAFSWQFPNMTRNGAGIVAGMPEGGASDYEKIKMMRKKTSGVYRFLPSACERASGSTVEGS